MIGIRVNGYTHTYVYFIDTEEYVGNIYISGDSTYVDCTSIRGECFVNELLKGIGNEGNKG